LITETQAETIGSMEVKEKAELILEQIRLCLATKDYIRAEIIINKVKPKVLEGEAMQDLKLKYHNLSIGFYLHNNRYLDACRAYIAIAGIPKVATDQAQWLPALQKAALLSVLSPFDGELSDILARLSVEKRMAKLPAYKNLVDLFVKTELMAWPLGDEKEFQQDSLFSDMEEGPTRLKDLRTRNVQHNLRVLAAYYRRITYTRASELLQLETDVLESALSDLVSSKQLWAKIDRPAGVILFEKKQSSTDVLNSWASDIDSLLSLVEDTCHLINRENMVHGLAR
jgi:26S proteasome regulatory subunit N5